MEKQTKRLAIWLILTFIFLLIFYIAAVKAESVNTDTIYDSQGYIYSLTGGCIPSAASNVIMNSLQFNNIESATPSMFKMFGTYSTVGGWGKIQIGYKPTTNYSNYNVFYIDSLTGNLIGTGRMGYTLGNNNEFYGYFGISSWNLGNNLTGILGNRIIEIHNQSDNQLIGTDGGFVFTQTYGSYSNEYDPSNKIQVFPSALSSGNRACSWQSDEYDYFSNMIIQFIRTPKFPQDNFDFLRFNTLSTIKLSNYVNGTDLYVVNDSSIFDILSQPITNNTNQHLQVLNPITGREWNYYWGSIAHITLTLNKTTAQIGEGVGGVLTADTSLITRITYTDYPTSDSTKENLFYKGTDYLSDFEKIGNQWYAEAPDMSGFSIPVSTDQVLHVGSSFTNSGQYIIKAYAMDSQGRLFDTSEASIEISPAPRQVLTGVFAIDAFNNANVEPYYLKLYDANSSQLVTQGWQSSPYFFWANAGHFYTANVSATGYYDNSVTYYIGNLAGASIDVYLSSVQNLPSQTQWVFVVYQPDINQPVQGALVSLSDNQSGYTDVNGKTTFIVPRNTLYIYKITKSGYISVIGNTTTWNAPGMITYADLYLQLNVTPTQTEIPTPTITICQPHNPVEAIYCTIGAYGITSRPKQDILLAFSLMIAIGGLFGLITRDGIGVAVGAGLTMAGCWGIGMIPTWFIIGCLAILGLVLVLLNR